MMCKFPQLKAQSLLAKQKKIIFLTAIRFFFAVIFHSLCFSASYSSRLLYIDAVGIGGAAAAATVAVVLSLTSTLLLLYSFSHCLLSPFLALSIDFFAHTFSRLVRLRISFSLLFVRGV